MMILYMKAKVKLPFLDRYENAWPAEALMRSHLCHRGRWGQPVSRPEHSAPSDSASSVRDFSRDFSVFIFIYLIASKQDAVVDDISELEGCRIAVSTPFAVADCH